MDINPQEETTKPISDDQELAKALAGVLPDEPEEPAPASDSLTGMQFEEIPAPVSSSQATPAGAPVATPATTSFTDPAPAIDLSALSGSLASNDSTGDSTSDSAGDPVGDSNVNDSSTNKSTADLSDVKQEALNELRPLIEKLSLPAEEKFDVYLLLIRNTDDATLIPAAHATAQAISDESRKAQALLDIIKEINYLSAPQPTDI